MEDESEGSPRWLLRGVDMCGSHGSCWGQEEYTGQLVSSLGCSLQAQRPARDVEFAQVCYRVPAEWARLDDGGIWHWMEVGTGCLLGEQGIECRSRSMPGKDQQAHARPGSGVKSEMLNDASFQFRRKIAWAEVVIVTTGASSRDRVGTGKEAGELTKAAIQVAGRGACAPAHGFKTPWLPTS